eukprot:2705509-Karenia_brevis.AAC.1
MDVSSRQYRPIDDGRRSSHNAASSAVLETVVGISPEFLATLAIFVARSTRSLGYGSVPSWLHFSSGVTISSWPPSMFYNRGSRRCLRVLMGHYFEDNGF